MVSVEVPLLPVRMAMGLVPKTAIADGGSVELVIVRSAELGAGPAKLTVTP